MTGHGRTGRASVAGPAQRRRPACTGAHRCPAGHGRGAPGDVGRASPGRGDHTGRRHPPPALVHTARARRTPASRSCDRTGRTPAGRTWYGPDTAYAARAARARRSRRRGPADANRRPPHRRPRSDRQGARLELGGARRTSGSAASRPGRRSSASPAISRATDSRRRRRARSRLRALAPCPVLLISDLGRPARFLEHAAHRQAALADVDRHVVPDRLREPSSASRSSPTCSAFAAPAERWAPPRPSAASYLGSYTGVLLATTAVPLWARSRVFLGPIFIATATATGAAATRLDAHRHRTPRPPPDEPGAPAASKPARCSPSWRCPSINERRLGRLAGRSTMDATDGCSGAAKRRGRDRPRP